jgi:hypothetical protein
LVGKTGICIQGSRKKAGNFVKFYQKVIGRVKHYPAEREEMVWSLLSKRERERRKN